LMTSMPDRVLLTFHRFHKKPGNKAGFF